jgi:choline dehydrogenase-like flavoprotein
LFDDFFESWQGPYGQRAYSLEYGETRPELGFVRGAKWQLMGTGGPLNATGSFPWGGAGSWGADFHKSVRRRFGHSAFWGIIAEDLPSHENRVVLDADMKDADGIPAPKMIYRASENTRKLLAWNEQQAQVSMREAGAYDTLVGPMLRETGWHMLGTARMGTSAENSVVDGFGRSHDVANLFIFDGSVMPTSGPVNPTATVAALALRNAEAIVAFARDQITSRSVA